MRLNQADNLNFMAGLSICFILINEISLMGILFCSVITFRIPHAYNFADK